jgi:hypothetical protein
MSIAINKRLLIKLLLLAFLLSLDFSGELFAQTGSYFNQRDDEYRLLGLKRAKEAYEFAKAEYERKKGMFEKNLISQQELDKIRNVYADSEVNYQQSLLAVLFEKQFVSVTKAVKRQEKDGQKHVRLTVANMSGGGAEFRKLLNIEDELFRSLQPDVINDIYISLLNAENAIISQPYEAKIEQLKFGEPVNIDFTLLQDMDVVTVDMIYGSGTQRSPKIYLQKDASVNKVIVQSEQFSQEVELGGDASFGLTLELFSRTDNTFKLEVVNLPTQINRYFVDPANQARLSQFKFTERANTRRASLSIFLPDRPTEEVIIDKPIPFYVLVIPREQANEIGNLRDRIWTNEEISKLNVGFVRLELVPRGIGKLLVRAQQLYHTIKPDQSVKVNMELINEGSRILDNVEIEVDVPLNWQKEITPKLVSQLDIKEEKRISFEFFPPEDVTVGRYEFRIRTTSLSDDQSIRGEDKTVTVEVQPSANIFGTAILIIFIVGIILGIVIFGIKLSRK